MHSWFKITNDIKVTTIDQALIVGNRNTTFEVPQSAGARITNNCVIEGYWYPPTKWEKRLMKWGIIPQSTYRIISEES